MTARRAKRLASIALILLLTVALVFLLYGPLREVLAPWLAWAYARISIYYRTVPQPVLWLVCVGLGVMIAARSLLLDERWSLEGKAPPASRGRVQTLRLWIRQAATEVYFDRRLALHLARLAVEIQSYAGGHKDSTGPMRQRLENLDLPPHVREYLRSGLEPMVAGKPRPFRLFRLRRLFRSPESQPSPEIDLEELVQLLEAQLEVRYESH